METTEISPLADNLRRIFGDQKTQQQGKKYRPHPRFREPKIWERAANRCNELGADPHELVAAAFSQCTIPGGPYPQHLGSGIIKRWYEAYRKQNSDPDFPDRSATAHLVQHRINGCLRRALHQKQGTVKDYFLSEAVPEHEVPPYVRVVLFPNNKEMLRAWGKRALHQLRAEPRLYHALQELEFDVSFMENLTSTIAL